MKALIQFLLLVPAFFAASVLCADIPDQIRESSSLLERGEVAGARAILEQVIAENPQHGPANLLLGQIDLQQFRWQDAELHLKIATTSPTRRPHLAWQLLGRLYLLQHNYNTAKDAFDRALEASPDYEPALIERSRTELFLNQTQTAIADLQKANSQESKLLLAQLYILLNQPSASNSVLQPLKGVTEAADWLLSATDSSPAKALLDALANNLARPEAYLAAAVKLARTGKTAQANNLFQISFQLDDQNPIPFLFLKAKAAPPSMLHPLLLSKTAEMKTLFDENKFIEAENAAKELVAAAPFHIPAYLTLIDIAEQNQDLWQALRQEQRVASLLPDFPVLLARIAEVERKMGALDAAECSARKAIQSEPDNGSFYYLLATIQDGQKQTDEAIASCKKSLAHGYENAQAYFLLGNLYYQKMQIPDAIAALQKAVELDPRAAENIASFALSVLTTEDYAALRTILEKHAQANPDNINTLYSLGVIYLTENRLEEAKNCFLKILSTTPEHTQANYNLALVYARQGNEQQAAAAMERFQTLKAKERADFERHNAAYRKRMEARDAMKQGRYDNAIAVYSSLEKDGLMEENDFVQLATAYQKSGKNTAAFNTIRKLLAADAYNRDALKIAAATADVSSRDKYRDRVTLLNALPSCK